MRKYILLLFVSASLLITGCAQKKDYVVTIHTDYGNMIAVLYDETPKHKENFLKLVRGHFYDSLLFHRVVPNFMIQGGDPYSKHAPSFMMLGQGGPGYDIEAEINPKYVHEKGALAAARLSDKQNPTKASNGSQFYIVQGAVVTPDQLQNLDVNLIQAEAAYKIFSENPANKSTIDSLTVLKVTDGAAYTKKLFGLIPTFEKQTGIKITKGYTPEIIKTYTTSGGTPNLDGEYTVFGKVVKGLEVIDSIAKQPTMLEDRPVNDVRMFVTVEQMPREEITKQYGYVYPTK